MEILHTVAEWRRYRSRVDPRQSLGFVPTMGSLHAGHRALVQQARNENAQVAVSIFVNPTQFNDAADFAHYPRTLKDDVQQLEGLADVVFCPSEQELYPTGGSTIVEVTGLSDILMGATRSGHFRGVSTVVTKLLNIIQPQRAYFGLKDYQQLSIIKKMIRDLFIDTEIVACPTVRDHDGLALSSRNARLTPEHRTAAVIIPQALDYARSIPLESAAEKVRAFLSCEPLAEVVSVDLRDAESLEEYRQGSAVLLLAVRFGDVLLIDQAIL